MQEMSEHVKFEGKYKNAMFAKNLFLMDRKKKDQIYLVVAAHDTKIDMKALGKHTRCTNIRAGDEEVMF